MSDSTERNAWFRELESLWAQVDSSDALRLEPTANGEGHSLRVTHVGTPPRAVLAAALRSSAVEDHLEQWPWGTLSVIIGSAGSKGEFVAVVKGGGIHLVTGGPEDAEASPATVAEWLERLTGIRYPLPGTDLVAIRRNIWGSPQTVGKRVFGFPHTLQAEVDGEYTLVGFGGYGANSYAVYFTRVAGPARALLRLPWGGAYMDPAEAAVNLESALRYAHEALELAIANGRPLLLRCNMGEVELYTSEDDRGRADVIGSGDDAAARMRELLRGTPAGEHHSPQRAQPDPGDE